MAFETHSDAYIEGGLNDVPILEIPDILGTLGLEDIYNPQTRKEAAEAIPKYFAIESKNGMYHLADPFPALVPWFGRKLIDPYLK